MIFYRHDLTDAQLLDLYKKILKPRLIEEKMLILIRQGKVSKWFSGIGQEAIAVGVTAVLDETEYVLPMHRNREFLPVEISHYTVCSPNGKEKPMVLRKEETAVFTLELRSIKSSE